MKSLNLQYVAATIALALSGLMWGCGGSSPSPAPSPDPNNGEEIINPSDKITEGVIPGLRDAYVVHVGDRLTLSPQGNGGIIKWVEGSKVISKDPEYSPSTTAGGNRVIRVIVMKGDQGTYQDVRIQVVSQGTIHNVLAQSIQTLSGTNIRVVSEAGKRYRLAQMGNERYSFAAVDRGIYELKGNFGDGQETHYVSVSRGESKSSPYISRVFDYYPAPGQFVNAAPSYESGDTRESMTRKAEKALVGDSKDMITLGGWGGFVIFGFDHTLVNIEGVRDLRIVGNAFGALNQKPGEIPAGSSEPGVVYVAIDANGNGIPDDAWYEIRGSGSVTSKDEPWYALAVEAKNQADPIRNYRLTYHRPTAETSSATPSKKYLSMDNYIAWSDNQNRKGYIPKNTYNTQSYYPQWIKEESMTFEGLLLGQNGVEESAKYPGLGVFGEYYTGYFYTYGYADNQPSGTSPTDAVGLESSIDLDWAVDRSGNYVTLPGIDFVKVCTGVFQQLGPLGESSTEIIGAADLHALGVSLSTRKVK